MCSIEVTPVVSTERLVLRGPVVTDAVAIAALAADRNVAGMTSRIPHPYDLADAEAFIGGAQRADWSKEAQWVIEHHVFGVVGGDYTVVCKNLNYTFLRPCFGPAVYRMQPRENIQQLIDAGGEFNIVLDLEILQQAARQGERDKRVGKCEVTFHVTPKSHHKQKAARLAQK